MLRTIAICACALALGPVGAKAVDYTPPPASAALLSGIDFNAATTIDEAYKAEFANCDESNTFRGFTLTGHYRCKSQNAQGHDTSDRNNVKALLRLSNGAIYWHSKMALDVDGSWAAWHGLKGTTQKYTSYFWSDQPDHKKQSAQVDPDRFPYFVIPADGIAAITHGQAAAIGAEFSTKTGLAIGNLGVVVYKGKWTPAFIADGGPFMRLGEASSKVFKLLGEDRCKKWSPDGTHCVGKNDSKPPYKDNSVERDVIFIAFPGNPTEMTAANAIDTICKNAKDKLDLTGAEICRK
jgi:hypothetical protein